MKDYCQECNHEWHGMTCQTVVYALDCAEDYECGCPTSFKLKE